MDSRHTTHALRALGAGALTTSLGKLTGRLALSKSKHRSLTGHARIARRVAAIVPFYEYDQHGFFRADEPPEAVAVQREAGFRSLAAQFDAQFGATVELTDDIRDAVSDLQFTDAYRVPFQFSRYTREHLKVGVFLKSSSGVKVTDLDGNEFYDVTGSYGVNLFGYDFYRQCIDRAVVEARELGPVLGYYHPSVATNVARLREISGLDEVSFHMSGTEAVMQAVRLARYHTRRTHLVRFSGAYHGWWGDVQPGVGNPMTQRETYTLSEMSEDTLHVLATRRDIACVLVNPLQALHPNANAPGDSALVDSTRSARFDREAYTDWLRHLRSVCTDRGIVLIFDEVFLGFRIALGGAQEYFGVRADMVTYGKTLGGGFPVGALCGRKDFMRRFRDDRPADICFARGTFNSHPYVMAAMAEFLRRLETPEIRSLYSNLDRLWNERCASLNDRLQQAGLPVRLANLSSVWTVLYTRPSRYNWMFQFYLRAAGLALSWIGTGRLIFSLNFTQADFEAVADRFVAAAQAMQQDGWWWADPAATNKTIRRKILKEILAHRLKLKRV